jgi:hypothetical protein
LCTQAIARSTASRSGTNNRGRCLARGPGSAGADHDQLIGVFVVEAEQPQLVSRDPVVLSTGPRFPGLLFVGSDRSRHGLSSEPECVARLLRNRQARREARDGSLHKPAEEVMRKVIESTLVSLGGAIGDPKQAWHDKS